MRRIEAKSHARPDPVRQRVPQIPQLLEPRAQRRARPGRALDPDLDIPGRRGEALAVAERVAFESGDAIVDGHAALTGYVRAKHHRGRSSVNASREISGTKRTPPAFIRRSSPPSIGRSRMTSSCVARSPTGMTSRPPGAS